MRVLVLGGTAEARALAVALESAGVDFVSSLAGRVAHPRMPVGSVRVGGFGGVDGLVRTLRSDGFTHLIDATHPFASTMTAHAVQACARTGLPMTRLARPGWADRPDSDTWTWVPDLDAAPSSPAGVRRCPISPAGPSEMCSSGWSNRWLSLHPHGGRWSWTAGPTRWVGNGT